MSNWWPLPVLASKHGGEIDRLLVFTHLFMALMFAGWLAFGLYTIWRFRRSRQSRAVYDGTKTRLSYYIEVGVILVEVVLLVGLSIPFWSRYVVAVPQSGDVLEVRVVAQQFAWNVHYPGKDGVFGRTQPDLMNDETNPVGLDRSDEAAKDDIVALNQLHVPVNRPVVIRLMSKDVIHSFYVPEFRVKQDAIPGMATHVSFTPTLSTDDFRALKNSPQRTFEIACAQLCGLGHFRMRGFVTVETPEVFQQWLDASAPSVESGEEYDSFFE